MDNDIKKWLGQKVKVMIDRPMHSPHPDFPKSLYEINYGYIPGTYSESDKEEIDAYVLGPDKPLKTFEGKVIAVVCRDEDKETKLVVTDGTDYPLEEIEKQIYFVEKYHKHKIYK